MTPHTQQIWWFLLGREPLLSAAEIVAASNGEIQTLVQPLCFVHGSIVPRELMPRLGGTIKIAREIRSDIPFGKLAESLLPELRAREGKINFGLSFYPTEKDIVTVSELTELGKSLKIELKAAGRSARYVPNREAALSSATVFHNNLVEKGIEFLITGKRNALRIAVTEAVQPLESFSLRDFGRPASDNLSGMLPPKLALMLINLAGVNPEETILDPSCGSGTIVTEALIQGFQQVIGSDISEKAVTDTTKNCEWAAKQFQVPNAHYQIFQSDARHLLEKLSEHSVDAIVTEPFLGAPRKGNETKEVLVGRAAELADLYSASFEAFSKIVKPSGTVVITLPRFRFGGNWLRLPESLFKKITTLGWVAEPLLPKQFSTEPFLLYARADQLVGREVWKFRKV